MGTIKAYSIKVSEFKQTKTIYIPVYPHIHHDGSGFRVRVRRKMIHSNEN